MALPAAPAGPSPAPGPSLLQGNAGQQAQGPPQIQTQRWARAFMEHQRSPAHPSPRAPRGRPLLGSRCPGQGRSQPSRLRPHLPVGGKGRALSLPGKHRPTDPPAGGLADRPAPCQPQRWPLRGPGAGARRAGRPASPLPDCMAGSGHCSQGIAEAGDACHSSKPSPSRQILPPGGGTQHPHSVLSLWLTKGCGGSCCRPCSCWRQAPGLPRPSPRD